MLGEAQEPAAVAAATFGGSARGERGVRGVRVVVRSGDQRCVRRRTPGPRPASYINMGGA
jgi:hypothetical protein